MVIAHQISANVAKIALLYGIVVGLYTFEGKAITSIPTSAARRFPEGDITASRKPSGEP